MYTYLYLALFACGVSVATAQLRIIHSYPLGCNFSYVTLMCLDGALPAYEAEFQVNATDIQEIIHGLSGDGNGTISFVLTQAQEGEFTCSRRENLSINRIALAAQPSIEAYQPRAYSVTLPTGDSEVTTELQCPIQPGALAQRYSVQWKRLSQCGNCSDVPLSAELFDIKLNVNSTLNGSQYQCEVTINHNGSRSRVYYGGVITLLVDHEDQSEVLALSTGIVICSLVIIILLLGIFVMIITNKRRYKRQYSFLLHLSEIDYPPVELSPHSPTFYSILSILSRAEFEDPECQGLSGDSSSRNIHQNFIDFSNAHRHAWPSCIMPIDTLHDCTSAGKLYYNKLNDFTLKIPAGAIPVGESLTIDIGVTLFGPFQYPEGLRPVSPVFWICVQNREHHKNFLKPIIITLQHCVNVQSEEDIESTGLTFLKGDHEMNCEEKYQFHPVEGKSRFKANTDYGTLDTYHFCYMCIACNVKEFTIRRAKFCLLGTVPRTFVYDRTMCIVFFVTFLLKHCLEMVRKQIENTPEFEEYIYQCQKKPFMFSDSQTPSIQIEVPEHLPGGWKLELQFGKEITQEQVDFFHVDENEQRLMEKEQIYPPRFRMLINATATTENTEAQICFTGTTRDESMKCNIPLISSPQGSKAGALPAPHHSSATSVTSLTPKNLMNMVAAKIPNKWMIFGVNLDIPSEELEAYRDQHDYTQCFMKVFSTWKRKCTPPYTWETVIKVLQSPSVNAQSLAEEIKEQLRK